MMRWAVGLISLLAATMSFAKDNVTWLIQDFPPSFIIDGPWAGEGILDLELRYLIERMPDFNHVITVATVPRSWNQIAHGDANCLAAALKTDTRMNKAVWSRAVAVGLMPGLIIKSDQAPRFAAVRDASGAVDLNKLAARDDLHGAYQNGRSYGPTIDGYIQRNDRMQGVQNPRQTFQMLGSGRIDYTFDFPFEGPYYRVETSVDVPTTTLPIIGEQRYVFAYVACSDGPVGRKVVGEVDEILGTATVQLPYFRRGARWYDPQDFAELMQVTDWPR